MSSQDALPNNDEDVAQITVVIADDHPITRGYPADP